MTQLIVEAAPAKLNLALHVTGQREDGYHLLDSLVVFCDAGDRIVVGQAEEDSFSVSGRFADQLGSGTDNLVIQARDLMKQLTGSMARPVAIELLKNLPVASGIGGGSSDAAATIRALSRAWNTEIADEILSQAALRLGADLPMCLKARTALARGIGEDLVTVSTLPRLAIVLVNPGVAVSTPSVFRALTSRSNPPLPALPDRVDLPAMLGWLAATRNDLEQAAASLAPSIGDALAALRSEGAAFARMSGSGATCFGIFSSQAKAERAAATLAARQPSWYVIATSTIDEVKADDAH